MFKIMTIYRKNYYEEIIDQMMIEEVAGLDKEIQKTLEGLDTKQKRMAILSILDKDRNLYMKLRKIIDENDLTKTQHIKGVVKMLRKYVEVGDVEKKKFGEVMTPISLVEDMLNTLPSEVWSNHQLRWLDSCAGVGVFQSVIVERLMEGLKEWQPDDERRYRHIMENMIYVGELQPKNMFLYLCAFDPEDTYDLNVYTGSFLEEGFDNHMKDIWKVDKFDIIVGNPPYQEVVSEVKTQQIWAKMSVKMFDILIDGGYLNLVHPGGWRFATSRSMKDLCEINNIYRNNEILNLSLFNYDDGMKTFGVNTDYDLVCLRKNKIIERELTRLVTKTDGEIYINLNEFRYIPTDNVKLYEILTSGDEKVDFLYSRSLYGSDKKNTSKQNIYPFVNPVIYGYPIKGINFIYSRDSVGHFGVAKVIVIKASIHTILDCDGEYGLSQYAGAIVDAEAVLVNIKKALDSDKFKELKSYFLGVVKQNRNACIDAPGGMFKIIKEFKKDFWKEFI